MVEFPIGNSMELREEFQDECNLIKMIDHEIEDHSWSSSEYIRTIDAPFSRVLEPWKLYFDGSTCMHGSGVGIVLISP